MKITVIIPTYRRPHDLPRLFDSLDKQISAPEEILILVGPNDSESLAISRNWAKNNSVVRVFEAQKPSVVHSINLGLSKASNEIICLIDDDVWLPPDWSTKIRTAFETNKNLGAFGGRDHLQNLAPYLSNPPLARFVGIFRLHTHEGNHHRGAVKSPIKIHVVKGVNLSFRRSLLIPLQIEPALEGQGAETCWEMDLCLRIMHTGSDIIYDNNNYVLHYTSPRLGFDNRKDVFSPAWPKRLFNESLIYAKFRPLLELYIWALRLFLIGTQVQPGILWSLLLIRKAGWRVLTLPWRNTIFILQGALFGLRHRLPPKKHLLN